MNYSLGKQYRTCDDTHIPIFFSRIRWWGGGYGYALIGI